MRRGCFLRFPQEFISPVPYDSLIFDNRSMVKIVLVNPEIPPNTGNISRTCAATKTELHLVAPLGFEISDRYLKRAGLDYWPYVDLHYHENLDAFWQETSSKRW